MNVRSALLAAAWDTCLADNLTDTLEVDIGTNQMPKLCRLLAGNATLTSLVLEGCHVADESAPALAAALAVHPNLTHLSLHRNDLGDIGLAALAAVWGSGRPPTLASLDLRANPRVTLAGWTALSRSLENHLAICTVQTGAPAASPCRSALDRITQRNTRGATARRALALHGVLRSIPWIPDDVCRLLVRFLEPVTLRLTVANTLAVDPI